MRLKRVVAASSVAALAFAASSSIGGCPGDDPPPDAPACTLAFLGDATKPVELEITARDTSGHAVVLKDGDDVALVYPPQGGRVIFVGARAINLDPCGVTLSGAIRDTVTAAVRLDNRTINLVPQDDGFGTSRDSDVSSFSNVPVCGNQWASDDVYDKTYEIQVTVADKTGRSATQKLKVVPRCAEPDRLAECLCICRKGYILGQACTPGDAAPPADAGVDASSTDGADDDAKDGAKDADDAEDAEDAAADGGPGR